VGFLWWGAKKEPLPEPKLVAAVKPADTAILLYGRFAEHLEAALLHWNDSLPGNEKLNPEKLEGLTEELGQYFETWFTRGFLPLDKEER